MPEHAVMIAVLIIDRPLCIICLAAKADMTVPSVRGYLARIARIVKVNREPEERCRACGTIGRAVSLDHMV